MTEPAFVIAPPRLPLSSPSSASACSSRPPRMTPRMMAGPKLPLNINILTSPGNLLPKLVPVARTMWHTLWRLFMSQLAPSDPDGRYLRPSTPLRLSDDASAPPTIRAPHLYLGTACPWCHRVSLALALATPPVPYTVHQLIPGPEGLWRLQDGRTLKQLYLSLNPTFSGRFTAPLLINAHTNAIVSNESSHILQILSQTAIPRPNVSLSQSIHPDIPALIARIHASVNDGVYKVGFSQSQLAYDEAHDELQATLDMLEHRLSTSRYLCSRSKITIPDMMLFPTLFRLDAVYSPLFRLPSVSLRHDYPALSRWLRDMYHQADVSQTCNLEETVRHYFDNLFPLNPSAITPRVQKGVLAPLRLPDDLCGVVDGEGH